MMFQSHHLPSGNLLQFTEAMAYLVRWLAVHKMVVLCGFRIYPKLPKGILFSRDIPYQKSKIWILHINTRLLPIYYIENLG